MNPKKNFMPIKLVSVVALFRNECALRWIEKHFEYSVTHFMSNSPNKLLNELEANDVVIGKLSLGYAAKLYEKGIKPYNFEYVVPTSMRGRMLTDSEFKVCKPSIQGYAINKI